MAAVVAAVAVLFILLATSIIDEAFLAFRVQNALALSILTGSNELAEHYYARWEELEPGQKPIVNPLIERGGSDEIETWFRERHPNFYETTTRWDPMRGESKPKRMG